jgi:hypothetical protein
LPCKISILKHWKQHTGFKNSALALLFLFFNCISIASPVLHLRAEGSKEVSRGLVQFPGNMEMEEENPATSVYVSHSSNFSVRQQHCNNRAVCTNHDQPALLALHQLQFELPDHHLLPLPGYYASLFLFNLF